MLSMVLWQGCVFAGDFWHIRGMLPVNPLNRVLEEFRDWKQPTLMLVGNHDQVWSTLLAMRYTAAINDLCPQHGLAVSVQENIPL